MDERSRDYLLRVLSVCINEPNPGRCVPPLVTSRGFFPLVGEPDAGSLDGGLGGLIPDERRGDGGTGLRGINFLLGLWFERVKRLVNRR